MQACITDMSIAAMSGIDIMFFDMAPIIIESIAHTASVVGLSRGERAGRSTRLTSE